MSVYENPPNNFDPFNLPSVSPKHVKHVEYLRALILTRRNARGQTRDETNQNNRDGCETRRITQGRRETRQRETDARQDE